MYVYPQKSKGFVIDYQLAEELEILHELLLWEEDYNELPLIEAIEKKLGVVPERVRHFDDHRCQQVQGLQGFDCDSIYILFDEYTERESPREWENLIKVLEERDVDLVEGSWAELE